MSDWTVKKIYDEEPASDGWDLVSIDGKPIEQPIKGGTTFGDYGREFASGLDQLGQLAGRGLQAVGLGTIGQKVEDLYKERELQSQSELTPAYKAEQAKTFFVKDEEGKRHMGPAWTSAPKILGSIAKSAPSSGFGMGLGFKTAGLLIRLGMPKVVAGIVGGAIGEGSVGGAQAAKDAYDTVMGAPIERLGQTEDFISALQQTDSSLSENERVMLARQEVAKNAAIDAGLKVGGATAILGAPSGAFMGKTMGGEIGKTLPRTLGKQGLLESFEEIPQSAYEQYKSNIVAKEYVDPTISPYRNVDEAAAEGGLTGFTMGVGLGGAAHRAGVKARVGTQTATETDTAAEPTKSAVDQQKAIENLKQGLHAGKISIDEAISWKPAFEKEGIPSATVDQVIAEYKKATGKKSVDEQLDDIFGAEPQKKVVEEPPTVSEKTEIKEPITFPHEQTAQMSKEVMEFDRKRKVAKAKKFKEDFATEEEGGIGVSEIEAEMAAKTAEKSRLAKEQEAQHLHGKRAALSRDAESLITFAKTYTSELSIPQEVKWDLEKRIEKAKMGNPEALQYLYDRFKTTPEFEASEPPEIRIAKEQADLKAKIEADKAEKKATKPEVETEIIPESVVDRINEQRPELGLVYQGIQPGAGKAPASHQFYFTEPNSGRHPNIGVVDLTEENLLKTIDDKIEEFRKGQEKLKAKKVKAKEKPPETKPEAAGETISDKGIGEPSQHAVGRAWVNNQFRPIIQAREIKRGKNKGKVQVVLPGGKSRMVEAKDVREWPGEKKVEVKEAPKPKVEPVKKTVAEEKEVEAVKDDIKIEGDDVVADIPKAEAKALTPKEQKTYLLAEIDKAIEQAPYRHEVFKDKDEPYWHHMPFADQPERRRDLLNLFEPFKDDMISLNVPGDGVYKILNTKEALEKFKKDAKSFPVANAKSLPRYSNEMINYSSFEKKFALFAPKPNALTGNEYKNIVEKINELEDPHFNLTAFNNWLLGHNLKPEVIEAIKKVEGIEPKPEATKPTKAEAEKTQFSTRLDTAISKGASRIATNEIARRTTERRSGDRRREVFNERYGRAPERRIGIERRKPSVTETAKDRIAEYGANLLKKQALDNLAFFKQVKNTFRKQTVKNNGDGTFTVATRYGEKYTVKSVKQIAENKASFEIAYGRPKGTAERIAGAYHPSTATIEIVKGVGDKWTLSHESYHLIKNLGKVTIGESKAIDSRIRTEKKDPSYKPTEEDQARWIEKALQERDKYRGTTIGKVLQRLGDLIDSFINLFHATSRSVLRGMESGKIYERKGGAGVNEFAQSVKLSVKQAAKNIMDNPNFKKWFGKSKVVDAEGRPLVVYHGTSSQKFRAFKSKENEFFFTDKRKIAEEFGYRIEETYLSLKKPYVIDLKGASGIDVFDAIDYAKAHGHDGVIAKNVSEGEGLPRHAQYVSFSPTQIKSIFNRGTFDEKNPNILYQAVYHGTMHIWPPEKGFPHGRPRLDKVGSGEGGAAFGHGFYMADAKDTGTTYRQIILDNYDNVLLDGSVATVDRMAEVAKDIIGLQRARTISKDALSRVGKLGSVEVAIKEIEGLQADRSMQKFPDVSWELSKQKELLQALGDRIKTTGEFGSLYTLDIPDSIIPQLLNWDKKVSDAVLDKIERSTKNKAVLNVVASTRKDNHFKLKPNLRSKYALPEVLRIIKTVGFTEDEITLVLENDGKAYEALTRRFPDLAEEEDWAENVVLDVWGVTSIPPPKTGGDLYNAITRALDGNQQEASEIFRKAGIPGNKYLDQFSREKGEGSYNYVIWDQKVLDKIALLERNGVKLDAIREMADQANTGIQYSTKLDPKLQALFDKSMSQPEGKGKSWLNRETGYMIKNIIQLLPRNHPALGFWEQLLKSPEWWDHENVQKIVKHAIERHDLFSENFNELIEDPLGGEGSLLENIQALKHKGLTFAQKMTGKTSKEYIDLMNMLDEGDAMTGPWNADKTAPVAERVALFEQYQRSLGISEETIRVWKSIRSAMDNALDKMIAPMVAILEKKKEEAAFAGKSKQEIEDVDIPEFINVFDEYKQEVNKKSLKEVIAEMESWRGFYAPRIRKQGKWAIRAKRGSGDFEERFFDMAPTRGSAERLADSIRKEGYTDVKISLTKRLPEEVYQHVSVMATEELLKKASEGVKLDDSSILAKFQEQLIQQTADIIRVRGYRGSMVHRKDGEAIRGYINDPLERTSRYLANTSAGLAKAETAARMVKELAKIDAATESNAYAAAQRYIEEQLRNADSTDRVIGIAKSVATFKYLGLPNIRAPFVNLTAMLTTAPAAIHQYVLKGNGNFAEVFAELGKAGKDYARFMTKGKTHNMSTDETVFMNEIKSKNYDDPQYTRDALGTIQALHGKAFTKAMNGSMWLFGKTEQWNRGATLLAAYRLAKKHGMTNAEAQEAAVDATGKAHGVYGKSTLPAWAQGKNPFSKIAQMAYTYQKFGHNWLQMCYDLGLKKKNIRAFVWAMASPIVLGGAAAIPLKTAVMSMVGFLLKSAGEDRDPEKYVWDTINEHIGPTTEKALRYGIVGLGGKGVDVSGSFSVDPGVPKNMIELTGAIGGVVGDLGEVMHQFMAGKPLRGLEALLPAGASSMIKAARESEEGASTRWGNKIFDERNRPYMPTMGETTLRAMGFRSSRRSTVQAKQWEQKKEVANFRKRQSMIYEKLKAWQMQKPDREKLKAILEEIFEYNKNVVESGNYGIPLITKQSIRGINRRQAIPDKTMRAIKY